MTNRIVSALLLSILIGGLAGCISTKTVSLQRKTQLENQILGRLARLEDALILASSARGGDLAPGLSPLAREAAEAAMTRAFNADDIDALRDRRLVGEGRDGLLALIGRPGGGAEAARVRALVAEENRARMVIMRRAIALSRGLGPADLPLVRRVFHRLVRRGMRAGQMVEEAGGRWRPVPKGAGR